MAVPREAAHSGVPKAGTLAAPPTTAEAQDQPGVPKAGGLSVALPASGAGDGAQSATLGDLRVLLSVPTAAAFGAEGRIPAAASAIAGPPLLGMGAGKLPKAPG